jgi:repressor LexA
MCEKVKSFVRSFQEQNGYSPSFAEIMKATGIKTRSHVNYILKKLSEEGAIVRQGRVARGIRLLSPQKENVVAVSLLGQIAANSAEPLIVHDAYDSLSTVEVPLSMIPAGTDRAQLYALQVKGNSMTDAMIADGDIVILKRGNAWKEGDIVAVWLDHDQGMTLKEIHTGREGTVKLKPKSHQHQTRVEDEADIKVQGRLLAVIRRCW